MVIMKKSFLFAALTAMSLCSAAPAALAADTYITPQTVIDNSAIEQLNILNNISSFQIGGEGETLDGDTSVIQPFTYLEGVNANVVNLINTIVNVQVDTSGMVDSFTDMRNSILSQYGIEN